MQFVAKRHSETECIERQKKSLLVDDSAIGTTPSLSLGVESPAEGNQSMSVKASMGLVQDMMDIHALEAPKSGEAESKIQNPSQGEEEKSIITEKSRSGRGKNGLRSTGTDDKSKEGKREDRKTSTSETKEAKKADSGTSKVTRVEWNDSEKKSYYQPLPRAKGNGRGSGADRDTIVIPNFRKLSRTISLKRK